MKRILLGVQKIACLGIKGAMESAPISAIEMSTGLVVPIDIFIEQIASFQQGFEERISGTVEYSFVVAYNGLRLGVLRSYVLPNQMTTSLVVSKSQLNCRVQVKLHRVY